MTTTITWSDILLRLVLTVFAGAVIGINRAEHGRPAGLRTNVLVCLAASLSMIDVNLLLGVAGKAPNSFVVLDLMRLPLGILSGMGFIGAGAILHKNDLVVGLTTAATLWFVTMLGICFGGGQIGLGLAALATAFVVLTAFRWIEDKLFETRTGTLDLAFETKNLHMDELLHILQKAGYRLSAWKSSSIFEGGARREISCEVSWQASARDTRLPPFLHDLSARATRVDWKI
jgi:putative Mg2+ transporter-C (MgtC) family protein